MKDLGSWSVRRHHTHPQARERARSTVEEWITYSEGHRQEAFCHYAIQPLETKQ